MIKNNYYNIVVFYLFLNVENGYLIYNIRKTKEKKGMFNLETSFAIYLIIKNVLILVISYSAFSLLFYLHLKKKKIVKNTYWEYMIAGIYKDNKQKKLMKIALSDFWLYLQIDKTYINLKENYEHIESPFMNGLIIFDMLESKEWEQIKENYYTNFLTDKIKRKNIK